MPRKLVVPLDGSKLGETVLPWATALAREMQASVMLVRIALARRYATGYLAAGVHKQHTLPEWREAESYLGQVKRRLEKDGLEVHTRVREGLIADNVLDIADDEGASAIALTTHGRHGMARFFLGSVAEGLVHETRQPLYMRSDKRADTPVPERGPALWRDTRTGPAPVAWRSGAAREPSEPSLFAPG
jgi:nucleotide-binding universal stress UspA family protein